jgi:hypothetical protein
MIMPLRMELPKRNQGYSGSQGMNSQASLIQMQGLVCDFGDTNFQYPEVPWYPDPPAFEF